MKKLLSVMACVAMVLVCGLTLCACGPTTTEATMKDYLDFVEENEIVFELDNYTYEIEMSELDEEDDTKAETYVNASGAVVKEEVGTGTPKTKEITQMSLAAQMKMTETTPTTKETMEVAQTMYYKDGKAYTAETKSYVTTTQEKFVQDIGGDGAGGIIQMVLLYAEDMEGTLSTPLEQAFEQKGTDYELKTGYEFFKTEDGGDVTFELNYANQTAKTKTNLAVTFNNNKFTKFVLANELPGENPNSAVTVKTTITAGGSVTLPADAAQYADMTEDGVVSDYDGSYTLVGTETQFENQNYGNLELVGNRVYKFNRYATANEMSQDQYQENPPKYIVLKVQRPQDAEEIKIGYEGEAQKVLDAEDDGIVIQLNEAKKNKKYVVTVKSEGNKTTTYKIDLSNLYNAQ